jgi:hypothetical protein
MMIKRINAKFKGGQIDLMLQSPNILITGPNGAGKSRIAEAVGWCLGREVAGMAPSSPEYRATIAPGDTNMEASIVVEDERGLVSLTRSRSLTPKGVLTRSVVTGKRKDGDDIDAEAYIAARFASEGRGLGWVTASAANLQGTLLRLGAKTELEARDFQQRVTQLAQRATEARSAVGKANAVVEAMQRSLDSMPTPTGDVATLEAALRSAQQGLREAVHAVRAAPVGRDPRLVAIVSEHAQVRASTPVTQQEWDAADAAIAHATAVLETCCASADEYKQVFTSKAAAVRTCGEAWRVAREAHVAATQTALLLSAGSCNQCRQRIDVSVRDAAIAHAEAAHAEMQARATDLEVARQHETAAYQQHMVASKESDAARLRLEDAEQRHVDLTARQQQHDALVRLEHEWVERGLSMPVDAVKIPADDTPLRAARAAHEESQAEVERVTTLVEQARAWQAAKSRLDESVVASSKAQQASDLAHAAKRAGESDLEEAIERGKSLLCAAATSRCAAGEVVLVNDAFGLRFPDGRCVSQRGLSAAQQLAMCVALDLGVASFDDPFSSKWQVLHIEADACDASMLTTLLERLRDAATLVIVTTCHAPSVVPAGWQTVVFR